MSGVDLATLQAHFEAALALPPADRRAYLEALELDPTDRLRLARMLERADTEANPLAPHLAAVVMAEAKAQQIGPWRLLRLLGSGGMGEVWLAERSLGDIRQRVALKRFHAVGEAARRRIARERRALAALAHPGIAALVDGGEDLDGRPWLAMQYVEGAVLPDWVAHHAPDLRTRLGSIRALCAALEHAHQRLILHRDIKPSNVIVRADGSPVLIDFGIATPAEDSAEATLSFTPAYAAPEQLAHRPATTATDVWGLGMLTYWLLTEAPIAELRARHGRLPPAGRVARDPVLGRRLRGELERILSMALAENPTQRYPTVAAFAADLDRYLAGRPVQAMGGRWPYRAWKFVRRHALACTLLAVLVGTGIGFLWRLEQETRRALGAERSAQDAARAASAAYRFLTDVLRAAAPEQTLGQAIDPRRVLDEAAQRAADHDGRDGLETQTVRAVLVELYARFGEPREVLRWADRVLAEGARILPERRRADVLYHRAQARLALGQYGEAGADAEAAAAIYRRLDEPERSAELGYVAELRARLALARGAADDALEALKQADVLWSGNPRVDAADRVGVAIVRLQASQRLGDESQTAAAVDALERARERLPDAHPERIEAERALAQRALEQGRPAAAIARLAIADALAERVFGADSRVRARVRGDLAVAHTQAGDPIAALELLRWQVGWSARQLGADSADHRLARINLAAALEAVGDLAAAIAEAQDLLPVLEADPSTNPDWIAALRATLARSLALSGAHARAVALMRTAVDATCRLPGPACTVERFRYAGVLRRARRLDASEAELHAIAEPLAELGRGNPVLAAHVERLAALLDLDRGRRARALERLRALYRRVRAGDFADRNLPLLVVLDLLPMLHGAGARTEAAQLLRAHLAEMRRRWVPQSPWLREAHAWQRRLSLPPS